MKLNKDVTKFLDELNHPLRTEIQELRSLILNADDRLSENIKWNGPNFSLAGHDRITMRIQPPTQIQLIFHRGAKVQDQPKEKLIQEDKGLLTWKENDRAIATFRSMKDIQCNKEIWQIIIRQWIDAG